MSATNTKKQKAWTPLGVIGLFFILIFAAICIAPFLYMLIMSFTHSTTLMISWGDVNFTDLQTMSMYLERVDFSAR